ncbi:MAG: amino-acid N-acetyltransferase [Verrucomicrobiota bacterium JB022]|nr:amino-acid N-acetyltransferase [Verrucomicrobiota bacterium JB022]
MPMDRTAARELQPADLRGILKYVPQWRGHVFIIAIDGAVIQDDNLHHLVLELAVMHNLGIRIVITHGIGEPLRRTAEERGLAITDYRGEGPTDDATLELAIEVAGLLEHRLVRGLTQNGLRCANANAVRATERGLLKGVDQLNSGKVDRIDKQMIRTMIDNDIVPVLSPIAFDRDGWPYRLNSDHLASALALELQASKLIFLTLYPGLSVRGEFQLNVSVQEVRELLDREPEAIDEPVRSKALHAVKTIEAGTPRAHLIDARIPDGLLTEIFSKVGIGSMIHANPYAQIRRARSGDVDSIHRLTLIGVREESLRLRTREELEDHIDDYRVYEIDDSIIGCCRLSPLEDGKSAEIASVFVHPIYQGRHIGRAMVEYAIEEARKTGLERVYALSTQTSAYFTKILGFAETEPTEIPSSLQTRTADANRRSRVLVRHLKETNPAKREKLPVE